MVIAGPNGVGKSTLLEILKRNVPSIRESDVQIRATASGAPLYIAPHRVFVSHEVHKLLPLLVSRKFRETQRVESLPGFPSYWGGIPFYLTSGTIRAKNQPDFAPSDVKRRIGEVDVEFNRALRAVYDKMDGQVPKDALPKDIYKPLKDFVERFLHLKFEGVKLEGDFYKVYFVNRLGVSVEYNTLSSGEQDAIAMMFPFIEKRIENQLAKARGETLLKEDIIVLLDGPEEYLHPYLQRGLMEYLRLEIAEALNRGEKLQFIIATHSPTIVNEAKPDELYVMHFPDQVRDGNQLVNVTNEEQRLKLIKEFLGDVSVLATGKPLLILEGSQDLNLLKILFPDIEKRFTLRYCGGKSEIKKMIKALQEIIPELWYKGFRMFAILDKDKEDIKNVDKLGVIYLLPTTCIENFLLEDMEAIYEALKVLVGYDKLNTVGINSEKSLEKLISEIIQSPEIKSEEIRRRIGSELRIRYDIKELDSEVKQRIITECVEPKIQRLKEKVSGEERKVNEILQEPKKALREFSGKLILGKLASKFSTARDELARAIAKELNSLGKVPKELVHIIEGIEKSLEK
jgi:energy-coupling factor transporter ATP-binding protein EcfA2